MGNCTVRVTSVKSCEDGHTIVDCTSGKLVDSRWGTSCSLLVGGAHSVWCGSGDWQCLQLIYALQHDAVGGAACTIICRWVGLPAL